MDIIDRGCWVMDVETIVNCFTLTAFNIDTKEKVQFVLHESRDDRELLYEHLNKVKSYIGYNIEGFDYLIIHLILSLKNKKLSLSEFITIIYNKAQAIIRDQDNPFTHTIPEWKRKIRICDLFKIWHFDNQAKATSLKWIQYMIDYPNIEEMPISHDTYVKVEDILSILSYNDNDVMSTYEFWLYTIGETDNPLYKGINKIQLRKDIKQEFNIPCTNYNDVKIGDELNKMGYLQRTGLSKEELKGRKFSAIYNNFTYGDCIPDYIKFKTDKLNMFFEYVKKQPVILNEKQEFNIDINGTIYTIMKGGIHSQDSPRIIKPNNTEICRDADIGSQYPNAFRKRKLFPRHLGKEWLEQYTDTIQRRLEAKSLYKKTKEGKYQAIQEAFKLALNGGGFGKTGEISSWQYDPFISASCTIGNQFEILMLIEDLEENGIHVVSANTDGILALFPKEDNDKYYRICKEWEKKVGNEDLGKLEYLDYKLFVQMSVNSYIAVSVDDKIKTKDEFVIDTELHKNKSNRIIPIALKNYFIDGISIEETIECHQNIFDFCLGAKSIGQNRLYLIDLMDGSETKLQKINRYYISNSDTRIIKKLPPTGKKPIIKQMDIFGGVSDGTRHSEINAGYNSTIYNKHIPNKAINTYNIDYSYYIDRAQKIIDKIEKNG